VLKQGDLVALVSPVNLPPKQYRDDENIMQYLVNLGYKPASFIANTDTERSRVDSFNKAINSGAKALLPISGNRYGENILHRLDYEEFKKNKTIYCTFSAASALLLALHFRTGVCTFYGPHISFIHTSAAVRENTFTVSSFWNMLTAESRNDDEFVYGSNGFRFNLRDGTVVMKNIYSRPDNLPGEESTPFLGINENQSNNTAKGRLLPSFLRSLERAISSRIEVDFSNRILMVEADETSFERATEIFEEINRASNISDASAIVLASFITHKKSPPNLELQKQLYAPNQVETFTKNIRRMFNDNMPVIYGFPMGHSRYKLTVPMGVEASLNLQTGDITLEESPFSNLEFK
jgi:muramoyltetrapeptide carboxypeptidase